MACLSFFPKSHLKEEDYRGRSGQSGTGWLYLLLETVAWSVGLHTSGRKLVTDHS